MLQNGLHAFLCHAAGEGGGVSFGDADVEGAVGHGLHEQVHGAACGHGGGDADDARVGLGEFDEGLAEDVLEEGGQVARVGGEAFAGLGVELAGGVPIFRGLLRRV